MRKLNMFAGAALLCIVAAAATAADSPAVGAAVNGAEAAKPEKSQPETPTQPARTNCVNRCTTNDAKCGSEVRRAKAQCARTASTAGHDPLTQRGPNDYTYFCGFFSNPGLSCGSGYYSASCAARFQQRYGLCLDMMTDDVAAMRFDCMKAEREAQRMCREELQECKAVCEN
jgi:hypothetical protein